MNRGTQPVRGYSPRVTNFGRELLTLVLVGLGIFACPKPVPAMFASLARLDSAITQSARGILRRGLDRARG